MRLCLDGVAAIKFLLDGGWGDFKAVFFAHMNFYKYLKLWKQKRNEIAYLKKENTTKNIAKKGLVWQHFVKGKKLFNLI